MVLNEVVDALYGRLKIYKNARLMLDFLRRDDQINMLLEAANAVAIQRLGYNDHGITHAEIAAFNSVKILQLLKEKGIEPSLIVESKHATFDDSIEVVVAAGYLHDIGNSVMRNQHELFSTILAREVINRYYTKITQISERKKSMIMEGIISHMGNSNWQPASLEAKIITVADACDMQEGRARIPYNMGKKDIHSMSALSIKKVRIKHGENNKPLRIYVEMDSSAGLFQIEELLIKKIKAANFQDYIEIVANITSSNEIITYFE